MASVSGTLSLEDYQRYGRQMILDGIGLEGQLRLQASSVAVVGAGGLGCPVLQYLAATGVGRIAIIDHDLVEISNLQRQVLHREQNIGMPKAKSAAQAIKELNSRLQVDVVTEMIQSTNALILLEAYDIIVDCTDNAPTRYLLSDTAVQLGKPLVSGAAQKFEGQLCTYNLGEQGPCYRCLFPVPPSSQFAGSCEETGILGAVTGIIGTLQALEAVKIITGNHDKPPSMLLFSAFGIPQFRTIKLRSRRSTCPACGDGDRTQISQTDYVAFCGGWPPDWQYLGLAEGMPGTRIRAVDFKTVLEDGMKINLVDVRSHTEFNMCHIEGSKNVHLNDFIANPASYINEGCPTFLVCKLGNDSQIAAEALRSVAPDGVVKDIIGGLRSWSKEVDPEFPLY